MRLKTSRTIERLHFHTLTSNFAPAEKVRFPPQVSIDANGPNRTSTERRDAAMQLS
jgi:hypothetical protein